MDITINYNSKDYSFNLYEEIDLDEDKINSEIKTHLKSYAFVAMLHKKCIKARKAAENERKRVFAIKFEKIKDEINPTTGRVFSNDMARLKAEKTKGYRLINEQYQDADHNCDILEVCVRAFEDRKDLMQTLASNLRKEQ